MSLCPSCSRRVAATWSFCAYCGLQLPVTETPRKNRTRGNGQGSVYRDSRTGGWVAQKQCGCTSSQPGKMTILYARRYGFKTKKEAIAALPELKRSDSAAPREQPLTMAQIFEGWKADYTRRGRKEKTLNGYVNAYAYFADLHSVPFAEISIDDLQEALDDCPHGKRTRQLMKNVASQLYKYAIPRRVTKDDTNLADYLYCAGESGKAKVRFSTEELELLKGAIGRVPFADYVYADCYLGYRPSEFCALDCANYHADGSYFVAGAKTEAGKNRALTVSPKVQPYVDKALAGRSAGPVWRTEDGEALTYDRWRVRFDSVLEALGIPTSAHPAPDGRYLTPHCCRHTARSLMDHAAGSERAKMALIGHASEEMSELYTHQELRDLREVTDSM